MSDFLIRNATEIPDFPQLAQSFMRLGWAEFILNDPVAVEAWEAWYPRFLPYAFAIWERETDTPAAVGLTVPLAWDGGAEDLPAEGWHWVLRQADADARAGLPAKTLSAVAAVVHPNFRGNGLAGQLVRHMKTLAAAHSLGRVIAPLRLSGKSRYPLTPIARYAGWRRADGTPFDPWLRVHTGLGARVVKPCERSIIISAPVAQWERWAGLPLPETGTYIIPQGDSPLEVNREEDRAVYVAPGIWVVHEI